LNTLDTI